jgi:hypothetical protein
MCYVSVRSLYEIVKIMVEHLPQILFLFVFFLLLLHIFIIPEDCFVL